MPRSHLVYLAVGNNPALHAQAAYAMLSALAFKGDAPVEIHLFTDVARDSTDVARDLSDAATDAPAILSDTFPLGPLLQDQITLDSLPPARIASLVPGAYDPYRLKLAVLREIALRFPADASIFCDADTFFLAPYAPLLDRITGGARVLHRHEYNIARPSHAANEEIPPRSPRSGPG